MNDLISRQAAINEVLSFLVEYCGAAFDEDMQNKLYQRLILLPSVEPEPSEIARDIATIIENEKDMRVILKNSEPYKAAIDAIQRSIGEISFNARFHSTQIQENSDLIIFGMEIALELIKKLEAECNE